MNNVHVDNIQNAFINPSSSRLPWIGAHTIDIIFLNDYRWMQGQITWDDFYVS